MNTMNAMEAMILSKDFSYEPPYFYRNEFAVRCELGIGEDAETYIATAKSRAKEIFDILFEGGVNLFFFDHFIYDTDFDMGETVYINNRIRTERELLRFCLRYEKNYVHQVIRNIPPDPDDDDGGDLIRRNRICCYPNQKFNAMDVICSQIDSQINPIVHLVSFDNSCIFTVYDDRGCDVVFYEQAKFAAFYPRLQPYFLDYDRDLMAERLRNCQEA